jgi:hypothetical protein
MRQDGVRRAARRAEKIRAAPPRNPYNYQSTTKATPNRARRAQSTPTRSNSARRARAGVRVRCQRRAQLCALHVTYQCTTKATPRRTDTKKARASKGARRERLGWTIA